MSYFESMMVNNQTILLNAVSSSEEDSANLDQLIRLENVNYQRKIHTNNLLLACDACEIIIDFL